MYFGKAYIPIGVFVILSFISILHADDQEFIISKNIAGYHIDPYAAVNLNTKDVVVIWLQIDKDDYFKRKIYAARCRLLKNGLFKVMKAVLVSDPDFVPEHLRIAYNPEDNGFVVAWGDYDLDGSGAHTVKARKLKGTGKTAGPVRTAMSGQMNYRYPVIHYTPVDTVPAKVSKGGYLIVYLAHEDFPADKDKAGAYSAFLDHKGKLVSTKVVMVSKPIATKNAYSNYITPARITRLHDGSYFCNIEKASDDISYFQYILKLGKDGDAVKEVRLWDKSSSHSRVIALNPQTLFASWEKTADASGWASQLYNPNLKRKKKEFPAHPWYNPQDIELVKLNADPGGYQISELNFTFYGKYISKNGKLAEDDRTLKYTGEPQLTSNAVCLPDSNRIFMVRAEGQHKEDQIIGFVFNAIEE